MFVLRRIVMAEATVGVLVHAVRRQDDVEVELSHRLMEGPRLLRWPRNLDRLIDYDTWANRDCLISCASSRPRRSTCTRRRLRHDPRDARTPFLSEMGYSRRLATPPGRVVPERPEHPDLDTLQALATNPPRGWSTSSIRSPEPATKIETSSGMRAAATILTQLVMHGVEHRAHVGTILGANGIEPPDLD